MNNFLCRYYRTRKPSSHTLISRYDRLITGLLFGGGKNRRILRIGVHRSEWIVRGIKNKSSTKLSVFSSTHLCKMETARILWWPLTRGNLDYALDASIVWVNKHTLRMFCFCVYSMPIAFLYANQKQMLMVKINDGYVSHSCGNGKWSTNNDTQFGTNVFVSRFLSLERRLGHTDGWIHSTHRTQFIRRVHFVLWQFTKN